MWPARASLFFLTPSSQNLIGVLPESPCFVALANHCDPFRPLLAHLVSGPTFHGLSLKLPPTEDFLLAVGRALAEARRD
jgi:hypothetical protein